MAIKLKDISLFEWIELGYIEMIIDNSRRIEYKSEDVIIFQWANSNGAAYIIQEWNVRVEINWELVTKINEWWLFWEIALITDEPRVASVIAESNIILLQIDQELLHTIIKKFKNWSDIQETFMKRILENIKR